MKCRDRVYRREFERISGACFFTNTHGVLQVVWHKMRGVPVWTSFRHISIYTGLWRKLRSYNQRIVESVCINVNLSDFRVPIAPHIHMWRQCLCDSICVRYQCGLESPEYLYDCRSLAEVESIKPVTCRVTRSVCINVIFDNVWLPVSSQIHMRWQWLCDRTCVGYLYGLEPGIPRAWRQFGGSWEPKPYILSWLRFNVNFEQSSS